MTAGAGRVKVRVGYCSLVPQVFGCLGSLVVAGLELPRWSTFVIVYDASDTVVVIDGWRALLASVSRALLSYRR